MWKVLRNGIHTLIKLKDWGLIQSSTCLLCGRGDENVSHLFFECDYTYFVQEKVLNLLHLHKPNRNATLEWYFVFKATRWRNSRSKQLLSVLKAVLYHLWRERNNRVFSGKMIAKHVQVLTISKQISPQTAYSTGCLAVMLFHCPFLVVYLVPLMCCFGSCLLSDVDCFGSFYSSGDWSYLVRFAACLAFVMCCLVFLFHAMFCGYFLCFFSLYPSVILIYTCNFAWYK